PEELYQYVYEEVSEKTAYSQTPQRWAYDVKGDIVIATNPYRKDIKEVDSTELILDATEDLKKGDYNGAIEKSSSVIAINPKSIQAAQAYNIKGLALFNLRQYQEALIYYEKTLELRPNYIEAINNKGVVYAAIGDYNKAIGCFNQSTDLNPSDASIWNYKGLAYDRLGKYEDAISSYDRAIILRHNYIEALNNRETSFLQLKKNSQEQQKPEVSTSTTIDSDRNPDVFASSSPTKKDDFPAPGQNTYKSGAPIGTDNQTVDLQSSAYTSNTTNRRSDTAKVKGAVPPTNTSSTYGVSEDNNNDILGREKEPQRSSLKILIPLVAVVMGVVIAIAIFGSGMMHQQPQPTSRITGNTSSIPSGTTTTTTAAHPTTTTPTWVGPVASSQVGQELNKFSDTQQAQTRYANEQHIRQATNQLTPTKSTTTTTTKLGQNSSANNRTAAMMKQMEKNFNTFDKIITG
ncbi:MAG: tetratricopeptide repeat protein, partial [Candidatus Nitrosopolaris sp.]